MNVFNSLGSNYDFSFVLRSLFLNDSKAKLKLKNYLEEKYQGKAILLYKGRETIELALRSLQLPEGSLVAFNGYTCYAVYKAVRNAKLSPFYIDVDGLNLNFSAKDLRSALEKNPNIKVVIIQNTLGYPAEVEEIAEVCKQSGIILIEDLAHSIGAKYPNFEAGTVSDFAALSFSQDKLIDGVSGGALIVRNKKYQDICDFKLIEISNKQKIVDRFYPLSTFLIRNTYQIYLGKILHTLFKKFKLLSSPMENEGENFLHLLSNWYCALIYNEFQESGKNLEHRKKISSIYAKNINSTLLSDIIVSKIDVSSNLRFPLFVKNRSDLIFYLKNCGVYVSDIWYDAPIAPEKYLKLTDYVNQCPNAEKVSKLMLNLPTHKNVSEKEAEKISERVNAWLKLQ